MDDLALRLLITKPCILKALLKRRKFASVELEKACKYAAEDAYITLRFYLYF